MKIGQLNRLASVQARTDTQDEAGQQLQSWSEIGTLWVGALHQTGMGAIRSRNEGNVSAQLAQYSFKARYASVVALGITNAHRLVLDGLNFDIKDVTRDLARHDEAFLVCMEGGNDG